MGDKIERECNNLKAGEEDKFHVVYNHAVPFSSTPAVTAFPSERWSDNPPACVLQPGRDVLDLVAFSTEIALRK